HRIVIEEEADSKKQELLSTIEEGQVLEGTVQRTTNFGAFVDIGGVDGLVHISQLAHEHVDKTSDVVNIGDVINVEVISIDWENVEQKINKGDVVEGTVKRLVNFGAFVEVLPGVEGLVHISQIANRHIGTPQEVLEVGQVIDVKVLDVNESEERISLSIRELEEEQEEAEYKQYEKDDDQQGFQFGDIIGDKLNKYK